MRDPDHPRSAANSSACGVELALASYPAFTPPRPGQRAGLRRVHRPPTYRPPRWRTPPYMPMAPGCASPHRTTRASSRLNQPPELPDPLPHSATRRAPLGLIAVAPAAATRAGRPTSGCGYARGPVALAGAPLTRRQAPELLPGSGRTAREPPSAAPPARGQLRHRGISSAGRGHHARFDPQAKGLGEWLRSRTIDIPETLLAWG